MFYLTRYSQILGLHFTINMKYLSDLLLFLAGVGGGWGRRYRVCSALCFALMVHLNSDVLHLQVWPHVARDSSVPSQLGLSGDSLASLIQRTLVSGDACEHHDGGGELLASSGWSQGCCFTPTVPTRGLAESNRAWHPQRREEAGLGPRPSRNPVV